MGVQVQGQSMTVGKGDLVVSCMPCGVFYIGVPYELCGWGQRASALEP